MHTAPRHLRGTDPVRPLHRPQRRRRVSLLDQLHRLVTAERLTPTITPVGRGGRRFASASVELPAVLHITPAQAPPRHGGQERQRNEYGRSNFEPAPHRGRRGGGGGSGRNRGPVLGSGYGCAAPDRGGGIGGSSFGLSRVGLVVVLRGGGRLLLLFIIGRHRFGGGGDGSGDGEIFLAVLLLFVLLVLLLPLLLERYLLLVLLLLLLLLLIAVALYLLRTNFDDLPARAHSRIIFENGTRCLLPVLLLLCELVALGKHSRRFSLHRSDDVTAVRPSLGRHRLYGGSNRAEEILRLLLQPREEPNRRTRPVGYGARRLALTLAA
ncbi:unnamed protein product [Ectocarpus sp. 13 AM-2016]